MPSRTRVAFECDEGQAYPIGTRVNAHPMDAQYRTLTLAPVDGEYQVARCEWIRDAGWRALRVSLTLVESGLPI